MKIVEWQKKKGISDQELAKLWGYDPSMIWYIKTGKRRPSPGKVWRLIEITGGKVGFEDVYARDNQGIEI